MIIPHTQICKQISVIGIGKFRIPERVPPKVFKGK
jgi:hypothetical protein